MSTDRRSAYFFTDVEYDTVLAALRLYMQCLDRGDELAGEVFEIANDSGECLDPAQIDELCDELQCGERS
jgi:hypothetical protein